MLSPVDLRVICAASALEERLTDLDYSVSPPPFFFLATTGETIQSTLIMMANSTSLIMK